MTATLVTVPTPLTPALSKVGLGLPSRNVRFCFLLSDSRYGQLHRPGLRDKELRCLCKPLPSLPENRHCD